MYPCYEIHWLLSDHVRVKDTDTYIVHPTSDSDLNHLISDQHFKGTVAPWQDESGHLEHDHLLPGTGKGRVHLVDVESHQNSLFYLQIGHKKFLLKPSLLKHNISKHIQHNK